MATVFVIDGYNLLHRAFHGQLERFELEKARELLQGRLRSFLASRKRDCRIVLVFDGARDSFGSSVREQSFHVVFSRPPETADDVVLGVCRQLEGNEDVCVVTSDFKDIGYRIRGLQCRHMTSEEFAETLDRAADSKRSANASPTLDGEKPKGVAGHDVDDWLREFGMHPEEDDW